MYIYPKRDSHEMKLAFTSIDQKHTTERRRGRRRRRMPCLYITTNLNLDGIDTDPIFSEATTAVSTIIGKPKKACLNFPLSPSLSLSVSLYFSCMAYQVIMIMR